MSTAPKPNEAATRTPSGSPNWPSKKLTSKVGNRTMSCCPNARFGRGVIASGCGVGTLNGLSLLDGDVVR